MANGNKKGKAKTGEQGRPDWFDPSDMQTWSDPGKASSKKSRSKSTSGKVAKAITGR